MSDHRRPQYGDYLARMEQQRRAESIGAWLGLAFVVIELAVSAGVAWWLTSGLGGALSVIVGAPVCAIAFLVLDLARGAFLSWILPSVANRLRGYTMPDDRGPDA